MLDPEDHAQTFSYGSGDIGKWWRNEESRLVHDLNNPWGAVMVNVWELQIKFGMKYVEGIEQMLQHAATIWPPDQFPLK